jgi:hypothetical protein
MRYLKTYKLFESSFMKNSYSEEEVKKTDEVIAELKDILLELSDIGYTFRVDYKVLSPRLITTHPEIQINITKKSEDILLPLWDNEDDKMEFDDVILRVLRYATSERYKYEYAGITTGAVIKGKVVNYSIRLYKE